MSDFDAFELRFAAAVRSDADLSLPRFDPTAVARAAVARGRRRAVGARIGAVLGVVRLRLSPAYLLVVLVLILALVVGAIGVGAIWRAPEVRPTTPTSLMSLTGAFHPLDGHVAIRLLDGRVLIVGGWDGVSDGAAAWLWDPSTESFRATGRMATGRQWPIAALLPDGQVLVAGGDFVPQGGGGVTALSSAELFDPRTQTFHPTGSMHAERGTCHCRGTEFPGGVLTAVFYGGIQRPSSVTLGDGRVFVIGGAPGPDSGAEIYDPVTGSFTEAGGSLQSPDVLAYHAGCDANRIVAAALRDGRVIVKCLDSAWLYDPRTDRYSATGVPATDSVGGAFVLADGRVLFTGRGRSKSAGRAEIFDPGTGAFHAVADATDPMSQWPSSTGVVLRDGRVVFIDGATVWVFDPGAETFKRVAPGPLRVRTAASATLLVDGRVLVVGPTDPDVAGPQELMDLTHP